MDYRRIGQKSPNDCGVCCLAMLLDMPYWPVRKAVGWHYKINKHGRFAGMSAEDDEAVAAMLGFKIITVVLYPKNRPVFIRRMLDGQRAILTVPSINVPGEWHAVFWDGEELFDPSPLKAYPKDGTQAMLKMISAVMVKEG